MIYFFEYAMLRICKTQYSNQQKAAFWGLFSQKKVSSESPGTTEV